MQPSAWKVHSPKFGRYLGALTCFVLWRTYTRLTQEYAALVTWPADAVKAQDSYLLSS